MELSTILTNPWFFAVLSIPLGMLVNYLSNKFLTNKSQEEYFRKVSEANKEIILSLRASISDGINQNPNVILSLMSATSRKYKLKQEDILTLREVIEDLIKEIMDSNFIPSINKKNLCDELSKLYLDTTYPAIILAQHTEDKLENKNIEKRPMSFGNSVLLGSMVTMLGFTAPFIYDHNNPFTSLLPILFAAISFLRALQLSESYKRKMIEEKKSNNK